MTCFGAALISAGTSGCEWLRGGGKPNVVMIVIDTLRADHLGAYGYGRPTSPALDLLAERGVRFANARATSSWTLPSVASLFTALYPAEHGLERSNDILPPEAPTMPEAFQAAGYQTVAFSANPAFVTETQGFGQGFEKFEVLRGPTIDPGDIEGTPGNAAFMHTVAAVSADDLTAAVLEWHAARHNERPYFLYVHYFDPHAAYAPPADVARRFGVADDSPLLGAAQVSTLRARDVPDPTVLDTLLSLYDAEIAVTDAAVGQLVTALAGDDARGTLVIATSDHGEEFGDHGGMEHGRTLFDELLHVPLIFSGAGVRPNLVVETPVSLVSIWATLADLVGIESPPTTSAGSLAAMLGGSGSGSPEALYADLDQRFPGDRQRHRRALVERTWKLIMDVNRGSQLHDVLADPAERTDLGEAEAERRRRMRTDLLDRDAEAAKKRAALPPDVIGMDAVRRAQLEALGYLQ